MLWKRKEGIGWEVWLLPCLRSLVRWMFGIIHGVLLGDVRDLHLYCNLMGAS